MYHVYIVTLPNNELYVGCTNNIARRKDQHNENIRKKRGKFASYISENYPGKFLGTIDLEIQASFQSRSDALKYEKSLTKSFISKAVVLNDNYNVDCSRKGKNIGNTAKEYVLIDIVDSTETYLCDLRQYCLRNGLEYSLIQRTVGKNCIAYSRYKAFYKQEWEDIEDKQYYISGKFYKDKLERLKTEKSQRSAKKYLVETPPGEIVEVFNLDKFAREHGLTSGTLHATYSKHKKTKGYQVIKRI